MLTDVSKNAIMAKLLGKKSADGRATIDEFFEMLEEKLVAPMVEAVEETIKDDMTELLDDLQITLDFDDSNELALNFMSDQNGGMIDFQYPVATLYELIAGKPGEETENGCYIQSMIDGLEKVIEKLKNLKAR